MKLKMGIDGDRYTNIDVWVDIDGCVYSSSGDSGRIASKRALDLGLNKRGAYLKVGTSCEPPTISPVGGGGARMFRLDVNMRVLTPEPAWLSFASTRVLSRV